MPNPSLLAREEDFTPLAVRAQALASVMACTHHADRAALILAAFRELVHDCAAVVLRHRYDCTGGKACITESVLGILEE